MLMRLKKIKPTVVWILPILLIVAAAWLSYHYSWQFDWTQTQRNTLTLSSKNLLARLEDRLELLAFLPEQDPAREPLDKLIEKYQREYADIDLQIIDPKSDPQLARELNINNGGELIIRYQNREQRLQQVSEYTLSNAIQRLLRRGERWLVFLQGHGERDPLGAAANDLSKFGRRLKDTGYQVQAHDLLLLPVIPDNTQLLILASPLSAYLPGEIALLQNYLRNGGNLLWMTEPGSANTYGALAAELGVRILPGVVVDAASETLNLDTPDFALISSYPQHPVTVDLRATTLLPQAAGLQTLESGWESSQLLQTLDRSWTETSPIQGTLSINPEQGDVAGPITVGIALTKPLQGEREQRVVVIGDSDFITNAYLANGANLELGLRLVNWLSGDENLIDLQAVTDTDIDLKLSNRTIISIGVTFLLIVPGLLLLVALRLWWLRRDA